MELHQGALNAITVLIIMVGALQCFLGYRIFKLILGLTGFLLGGILATAVGSTYSQELVFVLFSGLTGGIIGSALMVALYFVGIFLTGSLFGGILGIAFYAVAGINPDPAALLILAIIMGVLALAFQKFMIILSTAFAGAGGVVGGVAYFIIGAVELNKLGQTYRSDGSYTYAIILGWLALGIVGVIVQYRSRGAKQSKTAVVT